uniref:DNA-directed DNA polymerase n=1 Tax=Trichogramma kaykai TaxID=54128 RepID=A0ABD2VUC9_9HYME
MLPPESDMLPWVERAVNDIFEYVRSKTTSENSRIGLSISSKHLLSGRAGLSIRPIKNVSSKDLVDLIMGLVQSNTSFYIDEPFDLHTTYIHVPHGFGRKKQPVNINTVSKRSIVMIKNDDDLCLPRALIVVEAYLAYRNDITAEPKKKWERARDGRYSHQRELALQLMRDACVTIDGQGAGYEEIVQFQAHYDKKKISIVAFDKITYGQGSNPFFDGRKPDNDKYARTVFIDSLNYFHMKLSALPGAFGLPVSSKKGYFSHFFNTLENKEYIGPMPAASFYGLETMSTSKREKFLAWYETAREQIFDIRKEEIEYCRMDVEILRRACLEFRKTMLDLAGVDPFVQATTIASACSYMFRKKYLKENTIALIPPAGYRRCDTHSQIAIEWLLLCEHELGREIIHAGRSREHCLIEGYRVDGYLGPTDGSPRGTVFEFQGCFYHGCLKCYPSGRDRVMFNNRTLNESYIHARASELSSRVCFDTCYKYQLCKMDKFIVVHNKKRDRSPEDTSSNKRKNNLLNYWLNASPIKTQNRFEGLSKESNEDDANSTSNPSQGNEETVCTQKSAPIFVSNVHSINSLKNALNETAPNGYLMKILANNQVKIQPTSSVHYLPIITMLKERDTRFYTYQLKQDKPYKVVLKNVHPSIHIEDIKLALKEQGHEVIRARNILQHITRKPLLMFFVDLKIAANNKEIFSIKHLLNMIVTFEPPRKHRDIAQCTRCQEFCHTKGYCYQTPACVKCAGAHLTSACPIKSKSKDVKCVNCSGNHPASYKGCPKRKELQRKLYPALREKKAYPTGKNTPTNVASPNGPSPRNLRQPNRSYADAFSGSSRPSMDQETPDINSQAFSQPAQTVNNNKLESMMIQLMNRMDTMLNLLTCLINKIDQDIDILLVSETHFTNKNHFSLPNYRFYCTNHPYKKAHGGTAVIIKNIINHHETIKYQKDYLQATNVVVEDWNGSFVVSAIYCPPRHPAQSIHFDSFLSQLGHRYLCGGDWTAKHPWWGSRSQTPNPRGRQLYETIQNHNCFTISTGEPTYWPSDPNKLPDLLDFAVAKGLNRSFSACSSLDLTSDHSPVIIAIDMPLKLTPCTKSRVNWKVFNEIVAENLHCDVPLRTTKNLEENVASFNSILQVAVSQATSVVTHTHTQGISNVIRAKIKEKRKLRKIWQTSRNPASKRKLNQAISELKEMLQEERNNQIENYLSKLTPSEATDYSLWKATKRINKPQNFIAPIRKETGGWARTDQEKGLAFAQHLANVFNPYDRAITLAEEQQLL